MTPSARHPRLSAAVRSVALLALALVTLGPLTAGSASSLGGLSVRQLATGDVPVLPCVAEGFTLDYETSRDAVTGVRLGALERTGCPTAEITVALRGAGGRGLAESLRRLSVGADELGVTFASPPSADLVRGATVQLLTRPAAERRDPGAGVRVPVSGPRLSVATTQAPVPVHTCVLGAAADASVDQVLPVANLNSPSLSVSAPALTSRRHAYLHFDLAGCGMPVTAVVKSAVLALWLEDAPGASRTHALARAQSAWSEDRLTWVNQPAAVIPSAESATGTVPGRRVEWDVLADARLWSAGLAPNYGWRLADADPVLLAAMTRYGSRESAHAAQRPLLTITYRR